MLSRHGRTVSCHHHLRLSRPLGNTVSLRNSCTYVANHLTLPFILYKFNPTPGNPPQTPFQMSVPLPQTEGKYPNETSTVSQKSLSDFVHEAKTRLDSPDCDIPSFIRFALCGRYTDPVNPQDTTLHRTILINPMQDAMAPTQANLIRDIDSCIGTSNNLPFNKAFSVFPVSPFRETLTKKNHLSRIIPVGVVSVHKCHSSQALLISH